MADIEILNDEVLREIFLYLNIHDRQSAGLVCKKWQNVHEIMMRSINEVCCFVRNDFKDNLFVKIQHNVLNLRTNNPKNLKDPIEKFAKNIKKMRFWCRYKFNIPSSSFEFLAKCTKLDYVKFSWASYQSPEPFLKFLPLDNLEELSMEFGMRKAMSDQLNKFMKNVLARTPKLKSLSLDSVPITEITLTGGMGTLKSLFIKSKVSPTLNFDMMTIQNLEKLNISYEHMNITAKIIKLMKNCRKLHSLSMSYIDVLPETTLNKMMENLPNLRCLDLWANNDGCKLWYKFSNLEQIQIHQKEPFLLTANQIIDFLQRSKNLKTYFFGGFELPVFNKFFGEVAAYIGHECKEEFIFMSSLSGLRSTDESLKLYFELFNAN